MKSIENRVKRAEEQLGKTENKLVVVTDYTPETEERVRQAMRTADPKIIQVLWVGKDKEDEERQKREYKEFMARIKAEVGGETV